MSEAEGIQARSKTAILRAERGDTLTIEGFGRWTVVRRTHTYFGPKLVLVSADMEYDLNIALTAPGPNSKLQLWWPERDEPGWRHGWIEGPEVDATLVNTMQYDICGRCGEPIKTADHAQQSLFGLCEGRSA